MVIFNKNNRELRKMRRNAHRSILIEVVQRLLYANKIDISEDSESRMYLMTIKWRINDINNEIRTNTWTAITAYAFSLVFMLMFGGIILWIMNLI